MEGRISDIFNFPTSNPVYDGNDHSLSFLQGMEVLSFKWKIWQGAIRVSFGAPRGILSTILLCDVDVFALVSGTFNTIWFGVFIIFAKSCEYIPGATVTTFPDTGFVLCLHPRIPCNDQKYFSEWTHPC